MNPFLGGPPCQAFSRQREISSGAGTFSQRREVARTLGKRKGSLVFLTHSVVLEQFC